MALKQSSTVLPIKTIEINIENTLKQCAKWDDILTRFGDCRNDFERLKVMLGTQEVLQHVSPEIVRLKKSTEQAESLRNLGNEYFKCAKYDKALSYYSEAVRYAPHPSQEGSNSSVLALCFGNRSAAFFHMKQFHSCLADIDNAIHAGFPTSSMHKLLDRRGKCCLFLKHKQAAIQAFKEAKEALLAECSLQDKAKQDMIRLTEQFIKKCESLPETTESGSPDKSNKESVVHETTPKLPEASTQILSAANFLTVKEEPGRGRGLYAKRDIKVGQVLIVEKPYSSVVLPHYCLTHCQHCCARCFVPLPCEGCVEVVFCSSQCRQAAQKYHAAECQLMDCFHQADVRLGHLALKMVAEAGYVYLMGQRHALGKTGQESTLLGSDEKGVYDSENYATMYHLVGHSDERTVSDLWSRAVKAAFLVKCLEQTSFFPPINSHDTVMEEKRHEEVCYIGSHILRHLMMLPCNAHEVSEMGVNWQEPSMSETLEIGSAIYPVLSLINHSCDPSVVRHSYDNVCVVRAIRGIAAGEELFDNYGALYPVMDKAERISHLQDQYYFTCQCQACTQNWPMYMAIPKDVMHFYCEKCRGRVPVPSILQASKTEAMACIDCGHRQNIRNVILKVGSLEQQFQDTLHSVIFNMEIHNETLARLVHFLRVVDKYVHRPVTCHNDCQEAIKMCYAYRANAFPRKDFCLAAQSKKK